MNLHDNIKEFFNNNLPQTNKQLLQSCINDIVKHYAEPHRFYHNQNHISKMMESVTKHPNGNKPHQILETIFHDVIYNPKSNTNEEDSLDFMKTWLNKLYTNPQHIWPDSNWNEGILATKTHKSNNKDIQVLIDADLEILSEPWETYEIYAQAIREEYNHVTDEEFFQGRTHFLKKLLEQNIYLTQTYKQKETIAKQNILREIKQYETYTKIPR